MKSLYCRIRFFLRTGSLKFPALNSNISVAAEADEKLVKAAKAISDHENAIFVKKIAFSSLSDKKAKVVADYQKVHDQTDKLLASL